MLVNMVKNLSKNKLHHFQEFFSVARVAREAHVMLYVRSSVIKLRDTCIYIAPVHPSDQAPRKSIKASFVFDLKS